MVNEIAPLSPTCSQRVEICSGKVKSFHDSSDMPGIYSRFHLLHSEFSESLGPPPASVGESDSNLKDSLDLLCSPQRIGI